MKTKERFIMMLMLKYNVVKGKLVRRCGDVKAPEFKYRAATSGSHNIYDNGYYTNDFLQIGGAEIREPVAFFFSSDIELHETLCRYVYKKKGMKKPETQEDKDEIERLVVKKLLKLGKLRMKHETRTTV